MKMRVKLTKVRKNWFGENAKKMLGQNLVSTKFTKQITPIKYKVIKRFSDPIW